MKYEKLYKAVSNGELNTKSPNCVKKQKNKKLRELNSKSFYQHQN